MPYRLFCCFASIFFGLVLSASAAELLVGAATVDITPSRPVVLAGLHRAQISERIATPIQANILALEGACRDKTTRAVIVAVDVVGIGPSLYVPLRDALKKMLPDLDDTDLVLCATHTHSGPNLADVHRFPEGTDYMKVPEYISFAVEKIAPAVAEAWKNRRPARFAYGLDFAVVAYNRRAVYADGTAAMYGKTDRPDFRGMEGMEDHDIGTLFFWDENDRLIAVAVNVSCPSQEVERGKELHADFWHPVRVGLRKKYGKDLAVVSLCGAAGDMSPHTQYRVVAEDRMSRLRNRSRIEEMARRIVRAVDDTYEAVKATGQTDVPFRHEFAMVSLPENQVTDREVETVAREIAELEKSLKEDPDNPAHQGVLRGRHRVNWLRRVIDSREEQRKNPDREHEYPVHVFRIGDVAVMTSPFELFTAYGVQMKARSKATQTLVVQLADGGRIEHRKGYLPTAEARRRGGYSAVPQSIFISPRGGQILVEESLKMANAMFE